MMTANTRAQIAEINKKLDTIEDGLAWLIRPEHRFIVGQRVEWSRRGRAHGFPTRKKAQRGTVKAMSGFSVCVKLDGLKQQRDYHHAFFNPVGGLKLF